MYGYYADPAGTLALAAQIAEHLDEGFTAQMWHDEQDAAQVVLLVSGPLRIAVYHRTAAAFRNGRLTCTGVSPTDTLRAYARPYGHSIEVAMGRSAKSIAADITRKLLPAYCRQIARELEFSERRERQEAAERAEGDRLAARLPHARRTAPDRLDLGLARLDVHSDTDGLAYTLHLRPGADLIDPLATLLAAAHDPPAPAVLGDLENGVLDGTAGLDATAAYLGAAHRHERDRVLRLLREGIPEDPAAGLSPDQRAAVQASLERYARDQGWIP
ncbi:hypothetical protein [Bailinhaonella thermotolerans]|uniref:Uncharacterized protein n=1 Tax=Bailinhaonella thermotolerans TaxID=1070861 RepID=A0A3A4A021_9ACTN|nr:hypothetical protein [Bailinhaonella thermotolerans]RJL21058.1 hypothetical protein D5H75_38235 [Bailinhaonella thermotolerans]